jgi:hypothetical protein
MCRSRMGGGNARGLALRHSFGSALVLACSGCSFIFVSGPPSNVEKLPPSEPVECTTSVAAPVLDLLGTGVEVVRTGLAIGARDGDYRDAPISRSSDIALGAALTVLLAASTIYGFDETSTCDDAKARHRKARRQLESRPLRRGRRQPNPPPREPAETLPAAPTSPVPVAPTAPPPAPAAPATPAREAPPNTPPPAAAFPSE